MKLSANGRRLIQAFEGRSLVAYPDPKLPPLPDGSPNPSQKYSIGYGHAGARPGQTITAAEAEALFDEDTARFERAVTRLARPGLPHEMDALVSLAYNIGEDAFEGSTALRLHNAGDRLGAANAFRSWRKSAGAVDPVLVKRREGERYVYLNGYAGFDFARPYAFSPPATIPMVAPGLSPLVVAALVAAATYFALPKVPAARRALGLAL